MNLISIDCHRVIGTIFFSLFGQFSLSAACDKSRPCPMEWSPMLETAPSLNLMILDDPGMEIRAYTASLASGYPEQVYD